ncbi:MAG: hypothetical protein QG673_269 [Pseudomonadota bacterium]|nr:hypothetical protein [Pseudomonadota bacterium]
MSHFNVLDYVEGAVKLGMSDEFAKFQARKMESLYTVTIDEVRKEIKDEYRNLKDEHKNLKDELLSMDFATSQDLHQVKRELQGEIKELRQELQGEIKGLRQELHGEIKGLKLELQKEIVQSTNKVVFWIAGLLVATGLIQHFFK